MYSNNNTGTLIVLRTMIVRSDPLIVKCTTYLYKSELFITVVTSRVLSVRVSVSPCVSYHSHGWTDWDIGLKFGVGMCLDNISDEFIGQGQSSRSHIKLGNVIVLTYSDFSDSTQFSGLWCESTENFIINHEINIHLMIIANYYPCCKPGQNLSS